MSNATAVEVPDTHKTLVINGREVVVEGNQLTFDQVVKLAFPAGSPADTIYTVTFKRGPDAKREGTLVEGESVKIKTGMVFNVSATTKS